MAKSRPDVVDMKVADMKNESVSARDEDVIQRAIDAAAHCIDHLGLEKTSMEDIAREAGISRATLYRRFGNREAILTALLQQQARPFVEESIRIMALCNSFAELIERATLYAVANMPNNRFLRAMFESGVSRSNLDLIRPVYQQLVNATLLPALQVARANGELRPGLAEDEVSEWLMRDFLQLVLDAPLDEARLLSHIRQFMLPVLIAERMPRAELTDQPIVEPLETRLERMEKRMMDMQQMLGLLRQDLFDKRTPLRGKFANSD